MFDSDCMSVCMTYFRSRTLRYTKVLSDEEMKVAQHGKYPTGPNDPMHESRILKITLSYEKNLTQFLM